MTANDPDTGQQAPGQDFFCEPRLPDAALTAQYDQAQPVARPREHRAQQCGQFLGAPDQGVADDRSGSAFAAGLRGHGMEMADQRQRLRMWRPVGVTHLGPFNETVEGRLRLAHPSGHGLGSNQHPKRSLVIRIERNQDSSRFCGVMPAALAGQEGPLFHGGLSDSGSELEAHFVQPFRKRIRGGLGQLREKPSFAQFRGFNQALVRDRRQQDTVVRGNRLTQPLAVMFPHDQRLGKLAVQRIDELTDPVSETPGRRRLPEQFDGARGRHAVRRAREHTE